MLPFFRKIRYRLAKNNQFLKYSRYAIGEIVLVVIGILIALQINNWNVERKEIKEEKEYLKRLGDEIKVDIKYYDDSISLFKLSHEHLTQYIQESYEIQLGLENVWELFSHLYLQTDPLATANSTYRELTSTGKLNIFRNELLRKSIIDYYRINEDIENKIEEFNLVSTDLLSQSNVIVPTLTKLIPLNKHVYEISNYVKEDWSFINNPTSSEFQTIESLALIYRMRHGEHIEFLIELKAISTELDSIITVELKNFN